MAAETNAASGGASRPAADPASARCPLCGQANGCALAEGRPFASCWCLAAPIPQDVRERIPPERRGRACICAACAAGG